MCACGCGDAREALVLIREQGRKIDAILLSLTNPVKLKEFADKLHASEEALKAAVAANTPKP